MTYEFEGRTEKEAINLAATELGLGKSDFDIEILEFQRAGLFKKGHVRIRVHINQALESRIDQQSLQIATSTPEPAKAPVAIPVISTEFEQDIIHFLETVMEKMGYPGTVETIMQEENKISFQLNSEYSSILIGKKGKNLDALQLLVNVYAGKQTKENIRIILDSENYRIRHEESLVRLAYTTADKVRENRISVLLEPMNPFDRRLIHTTINTIADIDTKSEGDGLYKRVRVFYKYSTESMTRSGGGSARTSLPSSRKAT
ncbi:MAG: protein jag [Spirochaetaceae bacterium]|jgi:spoIIIJ-associated protein|nr:protein jag [Spirochaetaceae bacterium]